MGLSVHLFVAGVKTPAAPPSSKVTVPVGNEAGPVSISVTLTVHTVSCAMKTTPGVHEIIAVKVKRPVTATEAAPALPNHPDAVASDELYVKANVCGVVAVEIGV